MMNKSSVEKRVKRIEDSMNRIENGKYCDVHPSWITDQIAWLWKYRYIDKNTMERLADRMTRLFDEGYCLAYY